MTTEKSTNSTILSRIQSLAVDRAKAKGELKEASSERLKAAKEAQAELDDAIEGSNGCEPGDVPKFLAVIQDKFASKRHVVNETQEAYRAAKSRFDEADEDFFSAIEDSKQGSLFDEEGSS